VTSSIPADVSRLLDDLTAALSGRPDLVGIYLYGSLMTGDFSPAVSDIDVVVLLAEEPDKATVTWLAQMHESLRPGDPGRQLHCLYVTAAHATDAERLCPYWFGYTMTQWQLKVLTQAELASGQAWSGPWPPPGLAPVTVGRMQAAVRAELRGYYRQLGRSWRPWFSDSDIDHHLVALPRAAALLADGELITKGTAITRLAAIGVPDWLQAEIAARRAGQPAPSRARRKVRRALTARRIIRTEAARISRLGEKEAAG
jgi:predicted nucleotidyltransferase